MSSTVKERLPQHLYLTGVSWDYYEHLLELGDDNFLRITYCDGEMEVFSSDDNPFGVDYLRLENVPWAFYEETLKLIGDRPLRVTYSDGRMEIMSPLPEHEKIKKAIARLVEALTEELEIPIFPLGSATFRKEDLLAGLEPDECYYFANAAKARGMSRFDPVTCPPPDLAIEIDILNRSISREPICADLGIPELWRYRDGRISIRQLKAGKYKNASHSACFPKLRMGEFEMFVGRMSSEDQNAVLREYRKWVRTSFS